MDGQHVAIYARVSSDEQRENQTIQSQIETAKRWVEFQKMVERPLEIVADTRDKKNHCAERDRF